MKKMFFTSAIVLSLASILCAPAAAQMPTDEQCADAIAKHSLAIPDISQYPAMDFDMSALVQQTVGREYAFDRRPPIPGTSSDDFGVASALVYSSGDMYRLDMNPEEADDWYLEQKRRESIARSVNTAVDKATFVRTDSGVNIFPGGVYGSFGPLQIGGVGFPVGVPLGPRESDIDVGKWTVFLNIAVH